jgi:hypothetical protein
MHFGKYDNINTVEAPFNIPHLKVFLNFMFIFNDTTLAEFNSFLNIVFEFHKE